MGRLAVHEFGPKPKIGCVHRQYVLGAKDMIEPGLDFGGLRGIGLPGVLDADLNLANRDRGYARPLPGDAGKPGDDSAMRPLPPELGNDIGVK